MPEKAVSYYVLMRFNAVKLLEFRNTILRNQSILENYNGRCLGVTDTVHIVCNNIGFWHGSYNLAVLEFDTEDNATRWFQSDSDIKQPDFLDRVDVILIPAGRTLPKDKNFVHLTDCSVRDPAKFSQFLAEDETLMASSGSLVVSSKEHTKLRGIWDPGFVIIHHFSSQDEHDKAICSDDFIKAREIQCASTVTDEISFELLSIYC